MTKKNVSSAPEFAGAASGEASGCMSEDDPIFRLARLLGRQAADELFRELRAANDNSPQAGAQEAA